MRSNILPILTIVIFAGIYGCNQVVMEIGSATVRSVSTSYISTTGGESLVLTGDNFDSIRSITIGSDSCTITSQSVKQITCQTSASSTISRKEIKINDGKSTTSTGIYVYHYMLLGQPDFSSIDQYKKGLHSPTSVRVINNKLYISDLNQKRVNVYNSIPTSHFPGADLALGAPTTTYGYRTDIITSLGAYKPWDMIQVGTKLVISDYGNNRLLIWNSIPTSSTTEPDVIWGQPDGTSTSYNGGGSVSDLTVKSPRGLATDGTKLFVADAGNNRVLIFNSVPTSKTSTPAYVLGQSSFTTATANSPSRSASTLSQPLSVAYYNNQLIVGDYYNNRVLIWTSMPTANGQAANYVIGQSAMNLATANSGGISANSLYRPSWVAINPDDGSLWIYDTLNRRVLKFNSIPAANFSSANLVIGQSSFTVANDLATDDDNLGSGSGSVYINDDKLYIADYARRRVLIFDPIPTTDGASASLVIGQSDLQSSHLRSSGDPYKFSTPNDLKSNGTKMIVSDFYNSRVIIYNTLPILNTAQGDVILGQSDFYGKDSNRSNGLTTPLSPDKNTLDKPLSSCITPSGKVAVADTSNNRVLIWTSTPTTHGQDADLVLGQPGFTTDTANNGGISSSTMSSPYSIWCDDDEIVLVDEGNNRVLYWTSFPTTNNQAANYVLGQPDFVTYSSGTTQSKLNSPRGVYKYGDKIIVTDGLNHRVLIWNGPVATNGENANVVLGQPDFTSSSSNAGSTTPHSQGLNTPMSVYVSSTGKLFIADAINGRQMIWNSIPTDSNQAASSVLGQSSFTDSELRTDVNSIFNSRSVYLNGDIIYILDYAMHRIIAKPFTD
ncbi:MAG: IPT/TIG domain-containing protein [Bacteriovoracaceae bacterium]